jgi:hypothetical protein
VPVSFQDEPRVAVPKLIRDHHGRDTGSDHQRRISVPEVVERQTPEPRPPRPRPEYTAHEVVFAPHHPLRAREHQRLVVRPTRVQLVSQHIDSKR